MTNATVLGALAAVFVTALITMIMLGAIIWRQRAEQNMLWQQLTAAEQQATRLRAELAQATQAREPPALAAPIAWHICLACRAPLEVVLCPYCHAPYHQAGAHDPALQCWDVVVASGRCWQCRGDLTPFTRTSAMPADTNRRQPTDFEQLPG
jgi:hypothetical protein